MQLQEVLYQFIIFPKPKSRLFIAPTKTFDTNKRALALFRLTIGWGGAGHWRLLLVLLVALGDEFSHENQVGLQRVRGDLLFNLLNSLDYLLRTVQSSGQEHGHWHLRKTDTYKSQQVN